MKIYLRVIIILAAVTLVLVSTGCSFKSSSPTRQERVQEN